MKLHPKILELRNSIGHIPIHTNNHYSQPLEIRAANKVVDESNPRLLKMYFCIFGVPDDYGCVPQKGCFKKSLKERGPNSNATYKITALNQHRQHMPLCIPTVLKEDEVGLYAEFAPDEGVSHCDEMVIQVRSGTINNGSYGFNYVWDKMEYDEKSQKIHIYESDLYEISPVTIGSQKGTFAVRNAKGILEDEYLLDETEDLIKKLPRQYHLELRGLIARHITLASNGQPLETRQQALKKTNKPKQGGLDIDFLTKNFTLE
jgi:HK97 family phage prohead protease